MTDRFHLDDVLAAATLKLDLAQGERLWRDLESLSARKRVAFLRQSRKHRTFGVFRAGLAVCRKLCGSRPAAAVELAALLPVLAELIDLHEKADPALRFDWRAEAAVVVAQAKRSVGDFRGASATLDMADAFLDKGMQEAAGRAMFYVQRGSLEADLGEFERAVATLDMAAALFRSLGDGNSLGKVQLHQAVILRHVDPAHALELAEEGLTRIDLDKEARAELSAHWTMAYCHAELGEVDEAQGILDTYAYLIRQQDDYVRVIFDLLTSRIRYRQNRRAEAEQILRGVHAWYLERGFRFEAVLATLDLIELVVEDGRTGEALYLADEVLPILRGWGLHRDTLAVLSLIREKLDDAAIVEGFFRTLSERLRRSWHKNGRAGLPS